MLKSLMFCGGIATVFVPTNTNYEIAVKTPYFYMVKV